MLTPGIRSALVVVPLVAGITTLLIWGRTWNPFWRRIVAIVATGIALTVILSLAADVQNQQVVVQFLFQGMAGTDLGFRCDGGTEVLLVLAQLLALVSVAQGRAQNRELALLMALAGSDMLLLGDSLIPAMLGAELVSCAILFSSPMHIRIPRSSFLAFAISQLGVSFIFLTLVQLQAEFGTSNYAALATATLSPGATASWMAAAALIAVASIFIAPRLSVTAVALVGGISSGAALQMHLLQHPANLAWSLAALVGAVVVALLIFWSRRRSRAPWSQIAVWTLLLGFAGSIGGGLSIAAALIALYIAEFSAPNPRNEPLAVTATPLGFGGPAAVIAAGAWISYGGWQIAAGIVLLGAALLVSTATVGWFTQWRPPRRFGAAALIGVLLSLGLAIVPGFLENIVADPIAGISGMPADLFSVTTAAGSIPWGAFAAAAIAICLCWLSVLTLLGKPWPQSQTLLGPRQYFVLLNSYRRSAQRWLPALQHRYAEADGWLSLQPQLPLTFLVAGAALLIVR